MSDFDDMLHARAAARAAEAENARLRAELDALRAAPSDAEIEAWRVMWAKRIRVGLEMGEDDALLDEAVALMRRATAAPAASGALREAAKVLSEHLEDLDRQYGGCGDSFEAADLEALFEAWQPMRAALAAAPEAKEPR